MFAFASDVFRRYRASDFIFAQGTASGNRVEIDTNLSGCNICIIEIGLWGSVGWIWDFWGLGILLWCWSGVVFWRLRMGRMVRGSELSTVASGVLGWYRASDLSEKISFDGHH